MDECESPTGWWSEDSRKPAILLEAVAFMAWLLPDIIDNFAIHDI
jgi:hypothetical protein